MRAAGGHGSASGATSGEPVPPGLAYALLQRGTCLLLSERAKRLKVVVQARKGPAADDPRPVGKPRAKAETAVDDPVAFIAALELVPRGEGAPPKVERAKKKR